MSKLKSHLHCLVDPETGECRRNGYEHYPVVHPKSSFVLLSCLNVVRLKTHIVGLFFASADEAKLKAAQEVSENLEVSELRYWVEFSK